QNVTVCPTRLARPLDLESEGSFTNPEVMMKLYWGGASFLQVPVVFQKRGRGKGTGTRVRAVVTSIADIIGSWFRWIVLGGYPNRKTGRVVPSQARASSSADVPVVHANEPAGRGRTHRYPGGARCCCWRRRSFECGRRFRSQVWARRSTSSGWREFFRSCSF